MAGKFEMKGDFSQLAHLANAMKSVPWLAQATMQEVRPVAMSLYQKSFDTGSSPDGGQWQRGKDSEGGFRSVNLVQTGALRRPGIRLTKNAIKLVTKRYGFFHQIGMGKNVKRPILPETEAGQSRWRVEVLKQFQESAWKFLSKLIK